MATEGLTVIKQRHGIADAKRVRWASASDEQHLTVTDGDGLVILAHSSSDDVGLTPEQARYIADKLRNAADRIEFATRHADAHCGACGGTGFALGEHGVRCAKCVGTGGAAV